ncbi:SDR family oxidoreductase [Tritonibacter multivorans]|uniref:SDR family oxidoreductase n=1 Tax=Tritonibacter multivorans TaxID=928856 RepID=UPI001F2DAB88|nr:SDR family oxidoreductase [Tritonibacter multivorans]MDA7422898.1 SDR family oxidoreductase [Tritonibacter multivorans]
MSGGSSWIGKAIVTGLVEKGASVLITGRNGSRLAEVAAQSSAAEVHGGLWGVCLAACFLCARSACMGHSKDIMPCARLGSDGTNKGSFAWILTIGLKQVRALSPPIRHIRKVGRRSVLQGSRPVRAATRLL